MSVPKRKLLISLSLEGGSEEQFMRGLASRLASDRARLHRAPWLLLSLLFVSHGTRAFRITALAADTSSMDPHAYTALPIAAARALSTERNSGVKDPLARKLVAGEEQLLRAGANVDYMTRRALVGDELVFEQHRKGTRQVVSLGAGMDSRLCCQM